MSSVKRNPNLNFTPNFFLKKKICYKCSSKRHKLFLREDHDYVELFCKECKNKKSNKEIET